MKLGHRPAVVLQRWALNVSKWVADSERGPLRLLAWQWA